MTKNLNTVLNFCKKNKISNLSLNKITNMFLMTHLMPREVFELCMLELKKKSAIESRDLCKKYYETDNIFGYFKFCKEQQIVSKEFWIASIQEMNLKYLKMFPEDWMKMHWVNKEQFIKQLTDKEFVKFILTTVESTKAVQNVCKKRLDELEKSVDFRSAEVEKITDFQSLFKEVIQQPFQKPIQKPVIQIPQEEALSEERNICYIFGKEENFESLLPADWPKMTRSDRIEFIKRIQHEGFREYVLGTDPSLKNYFSRMKDKTSARIKLYVTLFQISANCSEEAKSILRCFVDNLNSFGRANLQFIECKNPNVIEIREMR